MSAKYPMVSYKSFLAPAAIILSTVNFTILPSVAAGETPTVPLVMKALPVANGTLAANEWKNALVLEVGDSKTDPRTRFYLQHDGVALWVGVNCEEPKANRPPAPKRGPEAVLSADDAVEVALGLTGGVERQLAMGGYAGATGKLARMEHLYEFVMNSAGSTARRYNEMALPSARFTGQVKMHKGGWQAEMRIPFTSLGLKEPAGQELYANFLRFRPPAIAGWKGMNLWGGYRPFPTDRIRLAASADEKPATVEKPVPALKESGRGPSRSGARVPVIRYYPLSNTIGAELTLEAGGKALLSAAGKEKRAESKEGGPARLTLELPQRLTPGQNIDVQLEIRKADGSLVKRRQSFSGQAVPEWAGTDAGQKYRAEQAPAPWKRPEVQGNTVRLAHASLVFGNDALPRSIKVAAGELLASATTLQLCYSGKLIAIEWARPTFARSGLRPVIYGHGCAGATTVSVRSEVDYDGFTSVQVRLAGKPGSLDKVQLSFPLQKKYAAYIARGSVQTILPVDAGGYKGAGGERFWLGSENGGLAFSTDLPFFKSADHRDDIAVQQKNAVRELVITPIDRAGQLPGETVLQFYLQPTPVRTPSKVTTDDYNLWFENWSDFQGYPDLAKMPQVKEHSDEAHLQHKKQLLYFNQLLAENAPGFKQYKDEFLSLPERMWYQRAYNPGQGVPCYVSCVRGPYGDLLLDGIRKLMNEGDIDGIYMDGTSVDWECDNPAHLACNEKRPPVWDAPGHTRILDTRNFLKRLRGIFAERGKPFTLVAHTGGGLDINTLGLVDFFWEGEQLARYLPGYRISKQQFAVGYSGAPWGYRTMFFDDAWLGERGENWSLAYDLLFNSDNQKGGARALLRPFETPGSTFHPYWQDGQALVQKSRTGRTSASYYTVKQGAMAVATNFGFYPDDVELKVGGLATIAEGAEWVDILTGTAYTAKNGIVSLQIPPYHGVALRPRSQAGVIVAAKPSSEKASVPELTGMQPNLWQVNETGAGVKREDVAVADGGAPWLVLKSQLMAAEANAWLTNGTLGDDAEVTLRLKTEKGPVVRIEVGPIALIYSGKWIVDGPIDRWNEKSLRPIPWSPNQEIELNIVLHDKELTVYVGNELLVDRMQLTAHGQTPRPLRISTWAGDSVHFQLVRLTGQVVANLEPRLLHPVAP